MMRQASRLQPQGVTRLKSQFVSPFFENTYELTVERLDVYVKQNNTWSTNKVSKIYEKQNGIWIQVNPRIKET